MATPTFFSKINFSQIKSESRRSSGDAREKCGSTQNKKNKTRTLADKGRYQRLVGKLIYLSHTRPNIAFAVSVVSQYMHTPCEEHLEVMFQIFRHLKITFGKGLFFKKPKERKL